MDTIIRNRIEQKVRKTLLSSVRSSTPSVEQILSLNEKDFSFVVDEIYKSESKAVVLAFRDKKSIILPAFGYFKFKPAREKVFDAIREVVNSYGYTKLSDVTDPVIRTSLMKTLSPIIRKINYDYIVYNKHKNEVLGNIFKK